LQVHSCSISVDSGPYHVLTGCYSEPEVPFPDILKPSRTLSWSLGQSCASDRQAFGIRFGDEIAVSLIEL
jgi:hypothetical protein